MSPAAPPTCQLVIPCYRDHTRLTAFLEDLSRDLPPAFTIQIVDDGSGREHAESLARIVAAAQVKLPPGGPQIPLPIFRPKNCGKGAAVRAGWAGAETELVGFADADGAVSAREIRRGYEYLIARLDRLEGLLGSRVKMLGRRVERDAWRHYSGRIFATAVSFFSRLPVYDSQCGFKLLKTAALAPLLPRLRSDRFAFDVELILELTAAGARLREFPVDWIDRAGSKVSVPREMLPMLWDVWQTSRRVRDRGPQR